MTISHLHAPRTTIHTIRKKVNAGLAAVIDISSLWVLFCVRVSVVEVDDEKPPAYDSLNGAAEQDLQLPSVEQKRNTFIGELLNMSSRTG